MNINDVVAKYIELRDRKATLKAEYDAKVAKVDEVLDLIESKLLEVFSTTGMESVRTDAGTAYVSTRTAASVADRDAFMRYVITNEEWPLLEVRASKAAVEQFIGAHDDVPPGVNWRSERVVNFRRS